MKGVAASKDGGGISRVVHVFHTDGTVLLQLSLSAHVVIPLMNAKAALAVLAVKEVISAADSADPASVAMKNLLPFPVVVKQIAN